MSHSNPMIAIRKTGSRSGERTFIRNQSMRNTSQVRSARPTSKRPSRFLKTLYWRGIEMVERIKLRKEGGDRSPNPTADFYRFENLLRARHITNSLLLVPLFAIAAAKHLRGLILKSAGFPNGNPTREVMLPAHFPPRLALTARGGTPSSLQPPDLFYYQSSGTKRKSVAGFEKRGHSLN